MIEKAPLPYPPLSRRVMTLLQLLFLLAVPLGLVNCASAQAGVAVSNIPLEGVPYTVLGEESVTVSWIGLDLGVIAFPLKRPPVEEALEELMKRKGGDALINIRYSTDRMIFLPVTVHRFHVTAEVVKRGGKESTDSNKKGSEKKR